MRKNIFLHFLNRDTREIFRVYELFSGPKHALNLRQPLNAATILCEDACYAPPGFVIEDDIAFELFERQAAYLKSGLVKLPIRERSLADYAEKKKGEYAPARNRYSGLYDDSRLNSLSSYDDALVSRKVQISSAIVSGFREGVDTTAKVWKPIKENASSEVIANLQVTPEILANEGKALTWSIILPHLNNATTPFHEEMRDALQHVYFKEYCKEYCKEYRLILLSDVPYMPKNFFLPSKPKVYSFRRLKIFLETFGASTLFLRSSAEFITRMRKLNGFIELIDSYVQIASRFPRDGDLSYQVRQSVERAKFNWDDFSAKRSNPLKDPTPIESREIADACGELAASLSTEHGLDRRTTDPVKDFSNANIASTGVRKMTVAIFVALEEELIILNHQLGFKRKSDGGASGSIEGISFDVLCPNEMGRVAAAVEITKYLERVKTNPKLIFCLGIAGGFKEADIDPGTVVCCDTVVDLASRKISDDREGKSSTTFRDRQYNCSGSTKVYSVAKSDDFDLGDWKRFCVEHFEWPDGRSPSLKQGKIASGDEVVASNDHREMMIGSVDKLLGVEMESGGLCYAAQMNGVPVAVLRVISDMADPSKADDKWRKIGMKTLGQLVKRLPLARVIELLNAS